MKRGTLHVYIAHYHVNVDDVYSGSQPAVV